MPIDWPDDDLLLMAGLDHSTRVELNPLRMICSMQSEIVWTNYRADQAGFVKNSSVQVYLKDFISQRTFIQILAENTTTATFSNSTSSTTTVEEEESSIAVLKDGIVSALNSDAVRRLQNRPFYLYSVDSMVVYSCEAKVMRVSAASDRGDGCDVRLFITGLPAPPTLKEAKEYLYAPTMGGKFLYDVDMYGIGIDDRKGVAVLAVDMSGKCVYASDSVETLYGWRREDLLGGELKKLIPPDKKNDGREIMKRLMMGDIYKGQFKLHKKNGDVVDINITDYPVFDRNGKLIAILGVSCPIQDKENEKERRQEQKQDCDNDGGGTSSGADGKELESSKTDENKRNQSSEENAYMVVSEEKIQCLSECFKGILSSCGMDTDTILGKSLKEAFPLWDSKSARSRLRLADKSYDVQRLDISQCSDMIVYSFTCVLGYKSQLEVDITAATKIAEEQDYKLDFISTLSHEMRTPLHGILGELEHIRPLVSSCSCLRKEEALESIEIIESSASLQLQLVNNILDWRKLASGKLSVVNLSFDLRSLIANINGQLRALIKLKRIKFEAKIDDQHSLDNIIGDKMKITQILMNFCSNAVKYTQDDGHVCLAVFVGEDGILITVTDDGPGIPETKKHLLFHRFSQVPNDGSMHTTDHKSAIASGGTGLGLYISRQLAEAIGGDVGYKPASPRGSVFWLRLPLFATIERKIAIGIFESFSPTPPKMGTYAIAERKNNLDLDPSVAAAELSPSDVSSLNSSTENLQFEVLQPVLLVEDNKINSRLLGKMLEKLGFSKDSVKYVENGKQAVEAYKIDTSYKLVLMDIQMPIMNGLDATRELRKNGCKCVIIGISANANDKNRAEGYSSGMNDFLVKPLQLETLRKCLLSYTNTTSFGL